MGRDRKVGFGPGRFYLARFIHGRGDLTVVEIRIDVYGREFVFMLGTDELLIRGHADSFVEIIRELDLDALLSPAWGNKPVVERDIAELFPPTELAFCVHGQPAADCQTCLSLTGR